MKNIKSLILISIIGMLSFAEFAFGQDNSKTERAYLESANLQSHHMPKPPLMTAIPLLVSVTRH